MRVKAMLACAFVVIVAVVAAGCGSDSSSKTTGAATSDASSGGGSALQPDPELQALVPEEIKSKGRLLIATDPSAVPIEFYDKDHNLVGSDIDVGNAVGQLLGLEVRWVPTLFDNIIPGLDARRFDAAISLADRPDREETVDFVVFFKTGRAFVAKAGNDPGVEDVGDLCGRDIALQAGTTMVEQTDAQSRECVAAGKPRVKIHTFPDANAVVLSIESGRSEFTMLQDVGAIGAVQESGGRLQIVGNATGGNDNNGAAFPKGSELAPVFQKAIQKLEDSGELERIFTKWRLDPDKMIIPEIALNEPFQD